MHGIARLSVRGAARSARSVLQGPRALPAASAQRGASSVSDQAKEKERNMLAYVHARGLSHVDAKGNPAMVNVSQKAVTSRRCVPRLAGARSRCEWCAHKALAVALHTRRLRVWGGSP